MFWSDALVWSQVGTRWRVGEANAGRETVAKARAAESETLLNDHSRIPDHELVARAKKHYESIALRTLGSNNLGKQVVLRLSKPTIENVFVTKVREAGSDLAYYSKKPRNPDSQVLIPFLSFDVTNAKPRVIGPAGIVEGESGQSLLAKKLKAELDADPSLESWDKLMLSLTRKAAEDSHTDAILRLGLLKDLTRIARDGSAELDVAMELVGRGLDDANVDDNLAWMDPPTRSEGGADSNSGRPADGLLRRRRRLRGGSCARSRAGLLDACR